MASPTFNTIHLFDSTAMDGSQVCAGTVKVHDYSPIIQPIQFNGENGTRLLTHGYPNRKWSFEGVLFARTATELGTLVAAIQTQADNFVAAPNNWYALVDNFGRTYTSAQIHSVHGIDYHGIDGGGCITPIIVQGELQGMPHQG
jgi:hypothetical protein